jgi:hypothetical protein
MSEHPRTLITNASSAGPSPASGPDRAPFVSPKVTFIGPMVELTLQFGGTFTTA